MEKIGGDVTTGGKGELVGKIRNTLQTKGEKERGSGREKTAQSIIVELRRSLALFIDRL